MYVKSSYRRSSTDQVQFASLKLTVSTLLGEVILAKLSCDCKNINGEIIQLIELQFSLTDGGMIEGAASELLKNETMHVGRVRWMAVWNTVREEILFTDSLQESIGVLNTKAGKPRKENKK